jgi:hypothetical protein
VELLLLEALHNLLVVSLQLLDLASRHSLESEGEAGLAFIGNLFAPLLLVGKAVEEVGGLHGLVVGLALVDELNELLVVLREGRQQVLAQDWPESG